MQQLFEAHDKLEALKVTKGIKPHATPMTLRSRAKPSSSQPTTDTSSRFEDRAGPSRAIRSSSQAARTLPELNISPISRDDEMDLTE
ncbi:unnamed protein product, partial [Mesorhabditis spiculigera]